MAVRSMRMATLLCVALTIPASLATADPVRFGEAARPDQASGYTLGIHVSEYVSDLLSLPGGLLALPFEATPLTDLPAVGDATPPAGGDPPSGGNPPGGGPPPESPPPPSEGDLPSFEGPPADDGAGGDGWEGGSGEAGTLDFDQAFSQVESPAAVPEPATLVLVGAGLAGAAFARRRRRAHGRRAA